MRLEPIIVVYDRLRQQGFSVRQTVHALAADGIFMPQLLEASRRRVLQVPGEKDQVRCEELRQYGEGTLL